jgi:hypothetical protein
MTLREVPTVRTIKAPTAVVLPAVPHSGTESSGGGGGGNTSHSHPNIDLLNSLDANNQRQLLIAGQLLNNVLEQEDW